MTISTFEQSTSGNYGHTWNYTNSLVFPEGSQGSPVIWGEDISLGKANGYVFFENIEVPNAGTAGVTINSVTFKGFSSDVNQDDWGGDFRFEKVDNADNIVDYNDISNITGNSDNYTAASGQVLPNWSNGTNTYESVDVTAAATEIFERAGWTSGNNMVLLLTQDSEQTVGGLAYSHMDIENTTIGDSPFQLVIDWTGQPDTSGTMSVFIRGEEPSGTIPLYTKAPIPDSGTSPLFIPSPVGHMPLFTASSSDLENNSVNLYTYGVNQGDSDTTSTTLQISGGQFSTAPLYVESPSFETGTIGSDLYISGLVELSSSQQTLFLSSQPADSIPLYAQGGTNISNNIPLHIQTPNFNIGRVSTLNVLGSMTSGSGITAENDIFVRGAFLADDNIPMFLETPPDIGIPLFIGRDPISVDGEQQLYIDGSHLSYLTGAPTQNYLTPTSLVTFGILNNGQPDNSNATLFLEGPNIQNALNLTTLNIEGFQFSSNDEITTYVSGPTAGLIPLYAHGGTISSDNAPLHIETDFDLGSSMTLYLGMPPGATGNIPLYLSGVYKDNGSISLTIPRPIDPSTIGTLPLFHRGYLE